MQPLEKPEQRVLIFTPLVSTHPALLAYSASRCMGLLSPARVAKAATASCPKVCETARNCPGNGQSRPSRLASKREPVTSNCPPYPPALSEKNLHRRELNLRSGRSILIKDREAVAKPRAALQRTLWQRTGGWQRRLMLRDR